MPSTTFQNLPYPAPTDPVDVPGDIQALAEAIDTKMLDKAVIDNKGDLVVGIGNDSIDNLAVGADKTVLVADSTSEPVGMKWDFVGVPTGVVNPFAGSAAPSGWLLCEGQAVSRTTYSALFAVLGTTYGVGDGSTTFTLPNMKGRVPVGLDSAQTEFDARGETGGAKTHTLTTAEMPVHTHTQNSHSHGTGSHGHSASTGTAYAVGGITVAGGAGTSKTADHVTGFSASATSSIANGGTDIPAGNHAHSVSVSSSGTIISDATAVNQNAGSGGAHNNLQPYIVLNYIIKT